MNKLYLIAVSLSMNLFYFGQSTIIFEEKSVQISNNVEIQALKLYSEINNGNEYFNVFVATFYKNHFAMYVY